MTTPNPHPTDALPLPELPTTGYLGDGNGYGYDETDMQDYARAAHREGFELAMSMQANEQWLVAKQAAIDVGGERPDLGYFVPSDLGPFPSFEECAAAITECGLPLGWVAIRLQQLIPGAFAPALASQPAHEQPCSKAQEGREPVYQIRKAFSQDAEWAWRDATEELFYMHPKEHRRMLYASSQPAQEQAPPVVWSALNKTSCVVFATEQLAKDYVASFPGSVSGGFVVSPIPVIGARAGQQQAGAAEVSDEQIDEVLLFETGFDGFGTQEMNSDDLRRVCRAVLALKTAGGVA